MWLGYWAMKQMVRIAAAALRFQGVKIPEVGEVMPSALGWRWKI